MLSIHCANGTCGHLPHENPEVLHHRELQLVSGPFTVELVDVLLQHDCDIGILQGNSIDGSRNVPCLPYLVEGHHPFFVNDPPDHRLVLRSHSYQQPVYNNLSEVSNGFPKAKSSVLTAALGDLANVDLGRLPIVDLRSA